MFELISPEIINSQCDMGPYFLRVVQVILQSNHEFCTRKR